MNTNRPLPPELEAEMRLLQWKYTLWGALAAPLVWAAIVILLQADILFGF